MVTPVIRRHVDRRNQHRRSQTQSQRQWRVRREWILKGSGGDIREGTGPENQVKSL